MKREVCMAMVAIGLTLSVAAGAADQERDRISEARMTFSAFQKTDPELKRFVESSAGYAVFPNIGKAAVGVGGANGKGILFDHHDKPVARVNMTQVTVGVQLGGQTYSEVIFFETPKAFSEFRAGHFTLAAQVSAVALAAGAAKSARYQNGVAIFTATKSGLMFEASVSGQKFTVEPL
jgi:lipid-binding SYLF domain-containing protein